MGVTSVPSGLGSRLNTRRRALGMSVGELARRTHVSRSNIHALLTGKRSPTPEIGERLIEALELDDELANEIRALKGSVYRSGFACGDVPLTRD